MTMSVGSLVGDQQQKVGMKGWVTRVVFLFMLGLVVLFTADRLFHPKKFRIEQVQIDDQLQHVDSIQIKEVVQQSLSGNYFSADLRAIERSIRDLPWVFNASLRKQWPGTLVVEIEEVQPVAEWGDEQWLNVTGDLVEKESQAMQLPRLSGPAFQKDKVWQAFRTWHDMFSAHGLILESLVLDERELWYLDLSLTALALEQQSENVTEETNSNSAVATSGKVGMIIDNIDATARITRFIQALNDQLISDFPSMKSIDLRYPNGFAIQWIDSNNSNLAIAQ